MKKLLLTLLLFVYAFGIFSQNRQTMNENRYLDEWKKVAGFEQKSLPKSAAAEVDNILRMAIADKNSPQVIKALIHQGKYDLALDAQNDTLIFLNLNDMVEKSSDVVEKSVLHSMLGELYMQYYQKDQWTINQRSELGDFVPADMKEWTRNLFYDKAVEHLNASVASRNELEKGKVEAYAAVVILGKDSRRFFPSMYDFLARRAVDIFSQIDTGDELSRSLARKNIPQQSLFAPADEFVELSFDPQPTEYALWAPETYRKWLASLQERKMDQSVVLTELDKLDYLSRLYNAHATHAQPSLAKMLEKWETRDFSVEIIDKMAEFYLNEIGQMAGQDSLQREKKTKELYDLLQNTIRRYPDYERISVLENRLLYLTQPGFSVSGRKTFPLKGEKKLNVTYKNLQSLTAKLYRIESPMDVQMAQSGIRKSIEGKRIFLKDIQVRLPEKPGYLEGETGFIVDVDEPGAYMLAFGSTPEAEENNYTDYYFAVSDLAVFSRSSAKDRYDFFVVDRITGEPVTDAQIHIYKLPGNWRNSTLTFVESLSTNGMGLAPYHKNIPNNDVFYHAVSGDDKGSLLNRLPYAYYDYSDGEGETKEREAIGIFTDRSLYRPGQTVYYKAILINTENTKNSIIAGRSIEFVFRDANRREISKQTSKTNEFGSVSGEFVVPQGTLPGNFTVETEQGSVNIRVEEYKRPTFEVTFDTIAETYKFDEVITLKGKAESFSGIKLQNATVDYRITRQQTWWWHWGGSPEHFGEGSVTTDENGLFEILFTPEKPDNRNTIRSIYTFAVEATVTDLNGETQVGAYTVTVGDISMMLNLEMADRWEKNSGEKILISAKNLDGNDISAKGTYLVFSLQANDSINRQVAQGNFETGEQTLLKKQLAGLSSGKYRVKLQSKDDRGNTVEAEKDIILFSYSDKRPPIKTNEWFIEKNTAFSPEKNAEVILGASEKVHVLYELWQENKLLEREWLELNNENRLFSFPYKPEYKNGVTLLFTYVKEEKFYSHRVELRPEEEKKELNVKLDVFRDKIRPGAHEEWRITVTDGTGNPAPAEVLASMYDFSLDNIYPSQAWNLPLYSFGGYYSRMGLLSDNSFEQEFGRGFIQVPLKDVAAFEFDRFNWFDFSLYDYERVFMITGSSRSSKKVVAFGVSEVQAQAADRAVLNEVVMVENGVSAEREETAPQSVPAPGEQDGAPQIRRNFNETAFFFPQLKTNEKGETQISFVVPESNTRWRFRVLAHDKNLNTGKAEAFTVSQKELMVTPNIPRFLRHGDRTSISTKISNLSDSTISGNLKLEFFNPVTDDVVNTISLPGQTQEFSLARNASSDASWTFDVPSDMDILGVRIVAQSALFSDGEQHALAVLPNRMLVTESMRMDVNGNQTKEFMMDRLINRSSNTIQDYLLTLEFASNPAWYAVQALPVLNEPKSDNAVSWFASYYANTLGAHISKTYPKVSAMVEAWKKQGGSKETFLSNLEKNQELKNVLLEETPWVLDARNESEQKEKLSLLFDLNHSQNRTNAALDKLKELQTTQGGWSWFKGFRPSVSITQYILYGFHQLKELEAATFTDDVVSMQSQAVSFIDAEAIRRFDALKKYNKDWKKIKTISTTDLEYLYVRSGYGEQPLDKEAKEMSDFYLSVVEGNWTEYGLYERSLIAVLMARKGKSQIVQGILESYREHASVSDEMGMYWANNRAHVFMSQSAVSVHTFIMDAFRTGGAQAGETDHMKRWLLKQKQTQQWESTHATMDAVYALLSTGSDWFSTQGETSVTLGNHRFEPVEEELGTGYFKESWSRSEIRPEMGRTTVAHQGTTPAWGALYWQYYEDMDKITKTDGALDIEKQLFIEQTGAAGTELVRISENNPLKVGDKVVVRLTVRTDRDLEFVHLKDMRAVAFEPTQQVSAMSWQNGVPYYQTSKDASTNFYFDALPRGTYVFEYAVFVNRTGSYSNGITTIQCMYAPEFTSHTEGMRIIVKE
jgi:Large extracellular alpha-helical protein